MKLREKFKKKKIARQEPFEKKVRKLKRKKIYKKEKCHFVDENGKRCIRNAIGSGQTCKKHGGEKDPDNVISAEALELIKYEAGYVTKFDPAVHPLQMIHLSKEGLSEVEIAANMMISVATLKKWAETYEEMSKAFDIAQALHESWWLAKGKDGLDSKFFNTSLFKFLTGNKLGYADKIETRNMNTNVHGVLVVPAAKSLSEWEAEGEEEIIDVQDI